MERDQTLPFEFDTKLVLWILQARINWWRFVVTRVARELSICSNILQAAKRAPLSSLAAPIWSLPSLLIPVSWWSDTFFPRYSMQCITVTGTVYLFLWCNPSLITEPNATGAIPLPSKRCTGPMRSSVQCYLFWTNFLFRGHHLHLGPRLPQWRRAACHDNCVTVFHLGICCWFLTQPQPDGWLSPTSPSWHTYTLRKGLFDLSLDPEPKDAKNHCLCLCTKV